MPKSLKTFLLLIFVLTLHLSSFSLKSFAEDKIIAIVNNDIITQKDLNDFVHFMRMQLSREYSGKELEEKIQGLKLDLLDKLIDDRLILQEANKENIKIDQNRVQGRINEIRKQFPTEAEFQRDLAKQGLTLADVEKKISEQMLMYYVVEGKVKRKIIVRPEEVTDFYNKNISEFTAPQIRQLETFTLERKNIADAFVFELRIGKSLEDLAARYPFTVGTLAVDHEGELRKDIEDVVFKLGVGGVSAPVKVNDKYIVFRLQNISPSKIMPLSEVQDKIQAFLFNKKADEELKKWLNEIKSRSYIKITQD